VKQAGRITPGGLERRLCGPENLRGRGRKESNSLFLLATERQSFRPQPLTALAELPRTMLNMELSYDSCQRNYLVDNS
jgi:hypothetical protein